MIPSLALNWTRSVGLSFQHLGRRCRKIRGQTQLQGKLEASRGGGGDEALPTPLTFGCQLPSRSDAACDKKLSRRVLKWQVTGKIEGHRGGLEISHHV